MKNFTLSTDSCCDELKSNLKNMDISYIPMTYIYNDELFQDNLDSMEDYKFFYDEMKRGKVFSRAKSTQNPRCRSYFEVEKVRNCPCGGVHENIFTPKSVFSVMRTLLPHLHKRLLQNECLPRNPLLLLPYIGCRPDQKHPYPTFPIPFLPEL